MSLVNPEFLLRPFADTGNVSQVPQTDASGFVNYTDGYTSAYEISLNANNPLAKAVERPIQNYLFRMLSQNVMAWQRIGFPAWHASFTGFSGYDAGAFVARQAASDQPINIYRSLVNSNTSDPINSPLSWELQPTVAETVARISMPIGGASGINSAVINAAIDFNTLGDNAMFMVGDDAVAAQCQNIPLYPGATAPVSGVLEVMSWTFNSVKYTNQRYTDRNGLIATRTASGSAWGSWNYKPSLFQLQRGQFSYMTITSANGIAWTGTVSPNPLSLTDGMEFKVLVSGTQSALANATLTVNGIAGANTMFGTSGLRVVPNEFGPGASMHIRWVASAGWEIISINAGRPTGLTASQPTHLVNASQAQNGTLNFIVDTLSSTTPNRYGGEFVPAISSPTRGLVVRFVAATANNANPVFRCTPNGADLPIRDSGGGQISEGVIQPADIVELTYLENQNYWVITNKTGAGAASAVPVGGIILVSTHTIPTGYLECDNSLQKIATLPQLYAAIGTFYNLAGDPADSFRLPNGRGVFVRGFDNGRGLDPGRVMGTLQQPDIGTHSHTGTTATAGNHNHPGYMAPYWDGAGHAGADGFEEGRAAPDWPARAMGQAGDHNHTFTTDPYTGETRPINVAWMYCIKAFDTPINQGTIDVAQLLAQVNAQKRMSPGQALYGTPGSYTFVVPADATPESVFEIQVWGGGGGGSGMHPTLGANGGGAGGYAVKTLKGLVPGSGVAITVGAGGAGGATSGANGSTGTSGTTSSFGNYCRANGGTSGGSASFTGTVWPPTSGGSANGGDLINATGGCGGAGQQIGTAVNGQIGGNGGNAPGGGGGGRGGWASSAGLDGSGPGGGGGGGAANAAGGAGANGAVIVKYN